MGWDLSPTLVQSAASLSDGTRSQGKTEAGGQVGRWGRKRAQVWMASLSSWRNKLWSGRGESTSKGPGAEHAQAWWSSIPGLSPLQQLQISGQ